MSRKFYFSFLAFALTLSATVAFGAESGATGTDGDVSKLLDSFKFTEGPTADRDGSENQDQD